MLATLVTAVINGLRGELVRVEIDIAPGLPVCHIVGLPDAALSEARERVRGAIRNTRLRIPTEPHHRQPCAGRPAQARRRLRPRDRRRHPRRLGPDQARRRLVGAAGRAVAVGHGRARGRRAADGRHARAPGLSARDRAARPTRPRRGSWRASRRSASRASTMPRGSWPGRAAGRPAAQRADRRSSCRAAPAQPWIGARGHPARPSPDACEPVDLADIRGQHHARWALEVALAGGHNLLLVGPPGAGKTLLARSIPGLLPPLDDDEALEVTVIESVAGLLRDGGAAARAAVSGAAPHQLVRGARRRRTKRAAGRSDARPPRRALPRRAGRVRPAGARRAAPAARGGRRDHRASSRPRSLPGALPARRGDEPVPLRLLQRPACASAAAQPGDPERYLRRVSGPLLDRIDIQIEMARVPPEELLSGPPAGDSATRARPHLRARARSHCSATAGGPTRGCPATAACRPPASWRRRRDGLGCAGSQPSTSLRRARSTACCAWRARSPTSTARDESSSDDVYAAVELRDRRRPARRRSRWRLEPWPDHDERSAWIALASVAGHRRRARSAACWTSFGSRSAKCSAALDEPGRRLATGSADGSRAGRPSMRRRWPSCARTRTQPAGGLSEIEARGLWTPTALDADYPASPARPRPAAAGHPRPRRSRRRCATRGSVAVVGTRRPTPAGRLLATRVAQRPGRVRRGRRLRPGGRHRRRRPRRDARGGRPDGRP